MSFVIRPAHPKDLNTLYHLATSLSAYGFLTLPSEQEDLEALIQNSQKSFSQKLDDPDQGRYLFVLEDLGKKVIGTSLVITRHGTPFSPHLYFQVNTHKKTLRLVSETTGRTELGGLILDRAYRAHPAKLGKRLSYVRLYYIGKHPSQFKDQILAELLPAFNHGGTSPLWESLGRKLTGMGYREADHLSKKDKAFVENLFPHDEISMDLLSPEAVASLGVAGPETQPVAKILGEVGFKYLHQIDPFDGGPHYGALQNEINQARVNTLLKDETHVALEIP